MERISKRLIRLLGSVVVGAALSVGGAALAVSAQPPALFVVDDVVHEPEQGQIRGVGWLVRTTPGPALAAVEVTLGTDVTTVPVKAVRRPDVAQHVGRADALESGWVFRLPFPGPTRETPGSVDLRFIDEAGDVLGAARGLPAERALPEPGAMRHGVFAWAVAIFLATAFVLRWWWARVAHRHASRRDMVAGWGDALTLPTILLAASLVVGVVVPPFQSPDEFDHVERAHALAHGQWMLAAPKGVSGVTVDAGLRAYMQHFESLPYQSDARVDREHLLEAQRIGWRGDGEFNAAPGTGYYLPIIYLPQALALGFGEWVGATIDASYRMARLASGLLASLMVLLALKHWRPSPLVMALLLLPMTLFQWSGAGIDALSIGATMLAVALWMEGMASPVPPTLRRIATVGLLVTVVVGCRIQLAPLLLIPLVMVRGVSVPRLVAGILPLLVVATWVLVALTNTQHPSTSSLSVEEKLLAYATDPAQVLDVVWTTVTTPSILDFYARSFIGVLGWLDTALPMATYSAWTVIIASAFAWSLCVADWRGAGRHHALLVLMALGSAVLVPALLLLMWTPFGAPTIDGVQGRYFLVPALLLAMAIPAARRVEAVGLFDLFVSRLFIVGIALYSLMVTLPTLIERYYG